jgi:hypothetical protein
MSIRGRLLTVVAALALLVGVGATQTASAATPSCGASCLSLFSRLYNPTSPPAFILAVSGKRAAVGQPIILARASNTSSGEDFTSSDQGVVSDFYAAGLVTDGFNALYANLETYEFQYSPLGVDSGLCVGVGGTPGDGTRVTLQPCGVSSKTVWALDPRPTMNSYSSLINAATAVNYSQPQVLTDVLPGLPVFTFHRTSINSHVLPNQLWGEAFGVLP